MIIFQTILFDFCILITFVCLLTLLKYHKTDEMDGIGWTLINLCATSWSVFYFLNQ